MMVYDTEKMQHIAEENNDMYSNEVIIIEAKGACTNSGVSFGNISFIKPINIQHIPPTTPIVQ